MKGGVAYGVRSLCSGAECAGRGFSKVDINICVLKGALDYDDWKITIDGVEIYQDYIKDHHYDIYSNIYIGDVTELLPTLPRYDLILFIDVLEHLDFEDGIRLLQECSQRCRNMIIATPRDIVEQEDVFENPYETHRTQWRRKHFRMFKDRFFIHYPFVMIYFIGDDCDRVKHLHSQGRKDRMMSLGGSYLPFLRKPHNSFRKMLKRS